MTGAAVFRGATLLVDTNLLLVLLVGIVDREQVARFKRTSAYTADDFDLLQQLVNVCRELIVTPHVLTEVSNLARHLPSHLRAKAAVVLARLVQASTEKTSASNVVVQHPLFVRLGLADAAIAVVAADPPHSLLVLTDDLDLYRALAHAGVEAYNFNHVRSGAWEL